MELGSGIGFTGIAICKTCNPKAYIFSDCHPCVLQQLTENIRLNGFTVEPETAHRLPTEPPGQEAEAPNSQNPKLIVAELDWGSVTERQLSDLRPDVIVAAGTFPMAPSGRDKQVREKSAQVFGCRTRSAPLRLPYLEAYDRSSPRSFHHSVFFRCSAVAYIAPKSQLFFPSVFFFFF